ncbi:unnamed protein product [Musa acuminata subsp. burmannicoides]
MHATFSLATSLLSLSLIMLLVSYDNIAFYATKGKETMVMHYFMTLTNRKVFFFLQKTSDAKICLIHWEPPLHKIQNHHSRLDILHFKNLHKDEPEEQKAPVDQIPLYQQIVFECLLAAVQLIISFVQKGHLSTHNCFME